MDARGVCCCWRALGVFSGWAAARVTGPHRPRIERAANSQPTLGKKTLARRPPRTYRAHTHSPHQTRLGPTIVGGNHDDAEGAMGTGDQTMFATQRNGLYARGRRAAVHRTLPSSTAEIQHCWRCVRACEELRNVAARTHSVSPNPSALPNSTRFSRLASHINHFHYQPQASTSNAIFLRVTITRSPTSLPRFMRNLSNRTRSAALRPLITC